MNQKPNSITFDFNIHFETSAEFRQFFRWLLPLGIAFVRLAIQAFGGS